MPRTTRAPHPPLLLAFALVAVALGGCSIQKLAVRSLGDALASGADVWASDSDPQLVREAMPFALKTAESLLAADPGNPNLSLAACSGFTQYAYAFVQVDAEEVEGSDYRRARELRARALQLYLRARGYCLAGLEKAVRGASREAIVGDPATALSAAAVEDVPLLYWTAASWGAAIALGLDRLELVADFPVVRALLERALDLDPKWNRGQLYETMISVEAVSEAMGGSPERARWSFDRAVAASGGTRAGTFVTWAEKGALPRQDRAEFLQLLDRALAVDVHAVPADRLANLVAQRRARLLRDRVDELFLDPEPEEPS